MFQKILSSIGIGSARLDLVLPRERYCAGEEITGHLRVTGGITEQLINRVYLELLVKSRYRDGDELRHVDRVLDHGVLSEGFRVASGQGIQEIPVRYLLPEDIPVTTAATGIYLVTGLDISAAVDPRDNDIINVLPGRRQGVVMHALEGELGFRRKRGTGGYNGRYQEFEYVPGSFMRGKLDELEVIYLVERNGIRLLMQIDKKSRGLIGLLADDLDLDERRISFFLSDAQLTHPREVAPVLARIIEQEYRKCL